MDARASLQLANMSTDDSSLNKLLLSKCRSPQSTPGKNPQSLQHFDGIVTESLKNYLGKYPILDSFLLLRRQGRCVHATPPLPACSLLVVNLMLVRVALTPNRTHRTPGATRPLGQAGCPAIRDAVNVNVRDDERRDSTHGTWNLQATQSRAC